MVKLAQGVATKGLQGLASKKSGPISQLPADCRGVLSRAGSRFVKQAKATAC